MNTLTPKKKSAKDAPKSKEQNTVKAAEASATETVKIEIKAPATTEVTVEQSSERAADKKVTAPKPKSKKFGGKKSAKSKALSADETREDEQKQAEKNEDELPAPLTIDADLLKNKIQAMCLKLEQQKLQITKTAQHVAFGFFLARTAKGNILTLQYHEQAKGGKKWSIRETSGKPLTSELFPTLWQAHQSAVSNF